VRMRFNSEGTINPCYSFAKIPFLEGQDLEQCDGLTWSFTTKEESVKDSFMTGLFFDFPEIERHNQFKGEVGQEYTIECNISNTDASYSVNG
jgi:hypothetical protein